MARRIATFVATGLPRVSLIVCHCETGISRSAAIAAALARWLHGDDESFFRRGIPNRLVYRTMLSALAERSRPSRPGPVMDSPLGRERPEGDTGTKASAPAATELAAALQAVLDAVPTPACARADHDGDRCPFRAARRILARQPSRTEAP